MGVPGTIIPIPIYYPTFPRGTTGQQNRLPCFQDAKCSWPVPGYQEAVRKCPACDSRAMSDRRASRKPGEGAGAYSGPEGNQYPVFKGCFKARKGADGGDSRESRGSRAELKPLTGSMFTCGGPCLGQALFLACSE